MARASAASFERLSSVQRSTARQLCNCGAAATFYNAAIFNPKTLSAIHFKNIDKRGFPKRGLERQLLGKAALDLIEKAVKPAFSNAFPKTSPNLAASCICRFLRHFVPQKPRLFGSCEPLVRWQFARQKST
jgi:hypothetical protein